MELRDVLRVLREQWRIPLLAMVLCAAGAVGAWSAAPPQYTSSTTLYVSAQATAGVDNGYNLELLAQQRVASYVDLAGSDRVAKEVISRLALQETPAEVQQQISVSSQPQTTVMAVTVTGESPEQVAAIANTVADVLSGLVDEFERPAAATGNATVAVRALEPAAVPDEPASLRWRTALALGALAGLLLGIGAAFLRHSLDRSVRSTDQLRAVTGTPVRGMIPFDRHVHGQPLTVDRSRRRAMDEAFRRLRTNLGFTAPSAETSVVLVTSASRGEGTTTTVCNLAIAVAASGRRVLVVDADLRRPQVSSLLGLERGIGLADVLGRRVALDQAVQTWAEGRFDVLASGPLTVDPDGLLTSPDVRGLLSTLRLRYDVVLVDTAPTLAYSDAAVLAPWVDGVLLVCRYRGVTADEVAEAAQALGTVSHGRHADASAHLVGTVLTMVPRRALSPSARPFTRGGRTGLEGRSGPVPAPSPPVPRDEDVGDGSGRATPQPVTREAGSTSFLT